MRPTWAEISRGRLRSNFRAIQQHLGAGVTVCAVVKANAYGHGALECARALESEGASWLGVTSTEEGALLREGGIRGRILLMTGFWRGEASDVVRQRLTPMISDAEQLAALNAAAGASRASAEAPLPVHPNTETATYEDSSEARFPVRPNTVSAAAGAPKNSADVRFPLHIKIDTGMSRLGVPHDKVGEFCAALQDCAYLSLEGVATHLASAEVKDAPSNLTQLARFEAALQAVRQQRLNPEFIHAANSAAIASLPQARFNFVRPGLALYGHQLPCESSSQSSKAREAAGPAAHDEARAAAHLSVEPVLSWKTRILGLRAVAAGEGVGYGGAFIAAKACRVAMLPVGYADGFNRRLSSAGRVLVRGQFAPVVWRVSMDLTMVDVTSIAGAVVGDEVVILGGQGTEHIDAWEHARIIGTLPYEVLCGIAARVSRQYVD